MRNVTNSASGRIAIRMLVGCLVATSIAVAQQPGQRTMGRYGWRWQEPRQSNNTSFVMPLANTGFGYVNYPPGFYGYLPYAGLSPYVGYSPFIGAAPYYGVSPYNGFNYVAPDPYADSAFSRAALLQAQANAVQSQAKAAVSTAEAAVAVEKARAQYLENMVRFKQIRTDQQAAEEIRGQQRLQERRAAAAKFDPPTPTELYSRLRADQLESATGLVHWPAVLLRPEFEVDRTVIERELLAIAQRGANPDAAGRIRDTANQMKDIAEKLLPEIGFDVYRETRQFLSSLSVEGYYALKNK